MKISEGQEYRVKASDYTTRKGIQGKTILIDRVHDEKQMCVGIAENGVIAILNFCELEELN